MTRRGRAVGRERDYSGLDIENWNIAMNTNVDPRRAAAISNAPKQDLRAWLAMMEAAGEVTHISGAEREREIGGIVDIYQRKIGNPLVLFDDIPGYPKGHRVLANLLTSIRRINMTMGNPADG